MRQIGVYRLNIGSCNGCDIEVLSVLATRFGLGELRAKTVEEPEPATVPAGVGGGTMKTVDSLTQVYAKLKEPKVVVVAGACALSSGIFQKSYSVLEPTDKFVPVSSYVPGCPPSPQVIADGLARALNVKYREWPALEGFRGVPELDAEKCTGCGACEMACPAFAIELVDKGSKRTVKYMYDKCINCSSCEEVCPDDAVHLAKKRHPSWPDRESMGTSAEEELAKCPLCGAFRVPAKQIRAFSDKIIEKVEKYKKFREDIERAAAVCSDCREKIANIDSGKAILFKLMV